MRKYIISVLAALMTVVSVGAQGYYHGGGAWTLPSMPSSLDFAGEAVPLENYDTRESLRRELLVTGYMHSRTFITLLNSKRYISVIWPIMQKYGIPYDFVYLCMAESGLDPNAVSTAGAGGLWQIMQATGRSYGLTVGKEVDERYDIEKATEAACKYLQDAYKMFGSWTAAAAAYNLGSGGLKSRMNKQGTDNYYDTYLPAETLRYMFRILSFKLISESPLIYGFTIRECDYYPPLTDYTTVDVKDVAINWSKVARDNGTTYKMLRELNHWIRDYEHANKAGKTFKVRIPSAGFRTSVKN